MIKELKQVKEFLADIEIKNEQYCNMNYGSDSYENADIKLLAEIMFLVQKSQKYLKEIESEIKETTIAESSSWKRFRQEFNKFLKQLKEQENV